MADSAGFVGRTRELSGLRAVLDGDTRLLLVAGDAGVGKTRFVAESLRRAAADGLLPVWGRAFRWPRSCRSCRSRRRWTH